MFMTGGDTVKLKKECICPGPEERRIKSGFFLRAGFFLG